MMEGAAMGQIWVCSECGCENEPEFDECQHCDGEAGCCEELELLAMEASATYIAEG